MSDQIETSAQPESGLPSAPLPGYALVGERVGPDRKTQTIRSPVSDDKWYERLATPDFMLQHMRRSHPSWTWKVIYKAHNGALCGGDEPPQTLKSKQS